MMILMITINLIVIVHVKDGDKEDKIRYVNKNSKLTSRDIFTDHSRQN